MKISARIPGTEPPAEVRPRRGGGVARYGRLLALAAALAALSSCAYYNTYYLARKYYFRGTGGAPYPVDGGAQATSAHFTKSIDYSKKVLAQYPKSKWVDDAYLLWAKALMGRDDPIQTVNMLQDFGTRFPKSALDAEAMFYLGAGNRAARHNAEALVALEVFLERSPRHSLAPYAHLERARALAALERPGEAAEAAGVVLERYSKSPLVGRALALRAEARLASGQHELARADFRSLGLQARDDEERLTFLLREADCLEAARDYDQEIALLKDAISHEPETVAPDTTGGKRVVGATAVAATRWGRLMVRYGSAQLLAGNLEEALEAYGRVTRAYPKTELAAEAQYRIGFAMETVAEDFDGARLEYARVREVMGSGPSATLATQRLTNLERLAQYRTAGGDSLQKRAEAGFLLAELYLFTHGKPERAVEEYAKIAGEYPGTPYAAKALNAQAWVLSRRLRREAEAESLFWRVVREYPATEGQLAARDYLESAGRTVPDSLIKFPEPPPPPPDTAVVLPAPPDSTPALGLHPGVQDSLRLGPRPAGASLLRPPASPGAGAATSPATGATGVAPALVPAIPLAGAGRDSAARDTTGGTVRDTTSAPPDTTRTRAPADTTRRGTGKS